MRYRVAKIELSDHYDMESELENAINKEVRKDERLVSIMQKSKKSEWVHKYILVMENLDEAFITRI